MIVSSFFGWYFWGRTYGLPESLGFIYIRPSYNHRAGIKSIVCGCVNYRNRAIVVICLLYRCIIWCNCNSISLTSYSHIVFNSVCDCVNYRDAFSVLIRNVCICAVAADDTDEKRIKNKIMVSDAKPNEYSLFLFFINTTPLFHSKSHYLEYYNYNIN